MAQGLFENAWQPMGFERFVVAVRRERVFVDHYRRITSTAHALGMKTVIHSCGNVLPLQLSE